MLSLLRQQTTRRLVSGVVGGTTTTCAVAGGAYYVYDDSSESTSSSSRLGLQRQAQFWWRVLPVVVDYYWYFGNKSPYVKYNNYLQYTTNDEQQDDYDYEKRRDQLLQELHYKHATTIYQCMVDLKGLYIKLGQVLSVTALPIPQAYRERFRSLQSDVDGYQPLDEVIKVLQQDDLAKEFSYIDPIPCGAASIGQAHRAVLRDTSEQVIIKVQYPTAAWQIPSDVKCVGDLLKICVWAGVVEEVASTHFFNEISRQFLFELDYHQEQANLQETYESSLDPSSPYQQWGIEIPKAYPELSNDKVITMSYLRGPKLEEEARRQLELLGIDTKRGLGSIVREAATATRASETNQLHDEDVSTTANTANVDLSSSPTTTTTIVSSTSSLPSWTMKLGKRLGKVIGVDNTLWAVRLSRRAALWSTAATASVVGWASPVLPESWKQWSKIHVAGYEHAQRLALTQSWIDALFDVHGYQIFETGLFNTDCHPGNILLLEQQEQEGDKTNSPATRLGLIDYGQCKRLTPKEQVKVAQLVLSVANNESDERVADAFRNLGVQTKNDSTEFLASMARLMLGSFQVEHLDHAHHRKMHSLDRITYFPKELSMVYRTALLLRGLAISLQVNPSVSEQWRRHAQAAVDRHGQLLLLSEEEEQTSTTKSHSESPIRHLQIRDEAISGVNSIAASS